MECLFERRVLGQEDDRACVKLKRTFKYTALKHGSDDSAVEMKAAGGDFTSFPLRHRFEVEFL